MHMKGKKTFCGINIILTAADRNFAKIAAANLPIHMKVVYIS